MSSNRARMFGSCTNIVSSSFLHGLEMFLGQEMLTLTILSNVSWILEPEKGLKPPTISQSMTPQLHTSHSLPYPSCLERKLLYETLVWVEVYSCEFTTSGAIYSGVPHLVNVLAFSIFFWLTIYFSCFENPKSTSLRWPVWNSSTKFSGFMSL